MINYSDTLEIFVLTFNRANFLDETLNNLLLQTDKSIKITVIDNCSTDGTEEVCRGYQTSGIFYAKTNKNTGWHSNAELAKRLATAKWIMLFHDDDYLHPRYCEYVIELIKKNTNIAVIGSSMSFETRPSNEKWKYDVCPKTKFFNSPASFAGFLYQGFPFCFSSSVFKTSIFKKIDYQGEIYGKVSDRPLILKMAEFGTVYIFKDKLIQYRIHRNQDSRDFVTGPFPNELAALHSLYFHYLGSSILTKRGRIFIANNYRALRGEYLAISSQYPNLFPNLRDYLRFIIEFRATTKFVILTGFLLFNSQKFTRVIKNYFFK